MSRFNSLYDDMARKVPDPSRMGLKDVALAFGVCYDTAQRWSKDDGFPRPALFGRRPRWRLEDLAWWALREENP